MIDPATIRMMDPNLLSNPSALLAFQMMFQQHGGHHGEQARAGMSPTWEHPDSPFVRFGSNRMQNLQLKLDAFQDRFTANGAQLTQATQRMLPHGVRWWNSLTNNVPGKSRLEQEEPDAPEARERANVSVRQPEPAPRLNGPSGETFAAPPPPRITGPNYPGADTWTRPPMPSGPSGSPFGGGIPSLANLGLRDAGAMTAPATPRIGGGSAAGRGTTSDSEDPDWSELVDAIRKNTDALTKLTDKLEGKGQRETGNRPGKSFMKGNIAPPRAATPRPPENGELAEPHL